MASERVTNAYARLFELRLLHHYWLDDGATLFDSLSESARNQRLLNYDVRKLLMVVPTESTMQTLSGLHGVFRATSLGAVVGVPASAIIADDAVFEFVVVLLDKEFSNYTALTLNTQQVVGLQHPPSKSTIRFKENVSVFSNLTGVSRGSGSSLQLFLSQEYPALGGSDKVESLVNVAGALRQLTSDQPGATSVLVAPTTADAIVFTHQGDVPAITAPTGIVGTPPSRGITLTDEIGPETFAVIRIAAVRSGRPDFSCTSGGVAKTTAPVFQIRFKNRSTVWRYFSKTNPTTSTLETGPFPLTYFGNATTTQKPTYGTVKVERSGSAITRIISDVFI